MLSPTLGETVHTPLNYNHLLGYTTLSRSSSVGLERCSATVAGPTLTSHPLM